MAQREVTCQEVAEARMKEHEDDGMPFPPYTKERWWNYRKKFSDGRVLYLFYQGSGMTIGISQNDQDFGYQDIYNYFHNPHAAWVAALGWDGEGEPEGWSRAKNINASKFRRRPDGDPSKEYEAE